MGTTSSDSSTVDGSTVEQSLTAELTQGSGTPPQSITCPEEMDAEEGKRYECTVVHPQDGPQQISVTMHADGGFRWFVP